MTKSTPNSAASCAENCQWIAGKARVGVEQLTEKFNQHPRQTGQNWGQHYVESLLFSLRAFGAGAVLFIHAIFPFVFPTLGDETIQNLNASIIAKRQRRRPVPAHQHPLAQSVHEEDL